MAQAVVQVVAETAARLLARGDDAPDASAPDRP
jgi:hypothetical protein